MKKVLLLSATVLMGLAHVNANEKTTSLNANEVFGNLPNFYNSQPISFVERGIEFMVFPDGSFDFNTHMNYTTNQSDYYYRTTNRRSSVNTTYGAPGVSMNMPVTYSQPRDVGVLIEHDANGKVRRIGNVFINYDRYGKIKRAGSIYMSYSRGNNGLLTQIGGMMVSYNNWGQLIYSSGSVNGLYSNQTMFNQDNYSGGYNHNPTNSDMYYYKKEEETSNTVKK